MPSTPAPARAQIYALCLYSLVCAQLLLLATCGGGGSNPPPTPPNPPEPPGGCSLNSPAQKPQNSASTTDPARILVFSATAGYRHASISAGQSMFQGLASTNGWTVDLTENAEDFNTANLENYQVVVWLNTTGDVLNNAQQSAFENYIHQGGGYVGIHSAADTEYAWPWYGELVGAWFASHPAIQSANLQVENQQHPTSAHLAANWLHRDEWYNYQSNPRADVNVLLSLDESSYDPGTDAMGDHPIAWYHRMGEGRAFYTGLGHTSAAYSDPNFVQHIEGALLWAGRMEKNVPQWQGSPPPDSDFTTTTLASAINEPMAMEISAAGEVFVIGRRGEFFVFENLAQENRVLIEKSRVQTNSSNEGGLIGFVLAPDFATSREIYLHYTSPTFAEHLVSRVRLNSDYTLDFASEVVILRYDVQLVCCHLGGDLDFDAEGNLYIATGDNTDPFASQGYSPIDERNGRAIYDAQRSSANTNDLRGKILRITPHADGSYSIPEGNLFVADSLHRAEIFSMGMRNPFRIHVDETTDWLYWGDIGADAGGSNPARGPGGMDEINRSRTPGNFGWPYLTGSNLAYIDYDFATASSGAAFDAQALVNLSPNNTGASQLPNAQPAWISMSHRALMVADVYRWNANINDEYKLPAYFHQRLLYWNFNDDRLYEVSTLDAQPTPRQWLNTSSINGMIDAEISAHNNRLYLLGYGGNCCGMPANAGMLVEVQYRGNGANPGGEITTFGAGDTVNLYIDGRAISANANNAVTLVDEAASNNEIFELIDAGDGAVALRSVSSGLYLTAAERGTQALSANASNIDTEQKFTYEQYSDGSISLRAHVNCSYVVPTADRQSLIASANLLTPEARMQLQFAQACKSDANYGLACREAGPAYLNFPATPADDFSNVPALLSQTGAFTDLNTLAPAAHLIPYDVIAPLWSDRADKQRWFSVPAGTRVDFFADEGWGWPAGSVFVKHFALPLNELPLNELAPEENAEAEKNLETRFIVVQENGVYGVTYKWRADNSDADLLTSALNEDIVIASTNGDWTQTWTYPGPEDCLSCHNPEANHILGVKTAALNKSWLYPSGVSDNQLRTLINLGLFSAAISESEIASFPAHAALDDESQSLEMRLRSYWDINCGNCHGPQGIAAHWDARFATPLAMQGIVNGALANQRDYLADYGLSNPYVVDPTDIHNSILYLRSASENPADRMPPLGRALAHQEYLDALNSWISGLE